MAIMAMAMGSKAHNASQVGLLRRFRLDRKEAESNSVSICHVRTFYGESRATKPPSTSLMRLQHVRSLFPLTCHINLRSLKPKKVNHKNTLLLLLSLSLSLSKSCKPIYPSPRTTSA
ncbi:hypothetical protein L6452_35762 [Arctium lappa]|uniref:Uncharacterized protein n=1 Tax=Arctium lappa TaxID=4217 RepID=A0ACB8Y6M5_ARCLA|nr:hypothetical protein L6452_35762 [Arctium lappa]